MKSGLGPKPPPIVDLIHHFFFFFFFFFFNETSLMESWQGIAMETRVQAQVAQAKLTERTKRVDIKVYNYNNVYCPKGKV